MTTFEAIVLGLLGLSGLANLWMDNRLSWERDKNRRMAKTLEVILAGDENPEYHAAIGLARWDDARRIIDGRSVSRDAVVRSLMPLLKQGKVVSGEVRNGHVTLTAIHDLDVATRAKKCSHGVIVGSRCDECPPSAA